MRVVASVSAFQNMPAQRIQSCIGCETLAWPDWVVVADEASPLRAFNDRDR